MPVAGLPAALETLLTSLLATEEPSSWKVDGEPGSVVVVLRFKQRDGQPLLTNDKRGYWKKKTPAQRRRDQRRAEQRRRGEQNHFEAFLRADNVHFDVAKSTVCPIGDARNPRSNVPADHVTTTTITFDPSINADHPKEIVASASTSSPPTSMPQAPLDAPQSATVPSPTREATLQDLQDIMNEIAENMSRGLQEHVSAVRKGIAEACVLSDVTECVPCIPSASLKDPNDLQTSFKRTSLTSPSTTSSDTRPAVRPRSAVPKIVNKTERSRSPPTRQQPARSARKK